MTNSNQQLIADVLADTELRTLVQRMRVFLRGRNAGELIGFNENGKAISCRLIGYSRDHKELSSPGPREAHAAYLFYGATAQSAVAEAVGTKRIWMQFAHRPALVGAQARMSGDH